MKNSGKEKAELEKKAPELKQQSPRKRSRNWKTTASGAPRLDVEADPKFKEFDRQAEASREFIYAQLLKSPGIDKATIDEIKKYGGPDKVKMAKIFEAINDPMIQRLLKPKSRTSKWRNTKRESGRWRQRKTSTEVYQDTRAGFFAASRRASRRRRSKHLVKNLGKVEWFATKEVPAGAEADAKKAIEADNAFVLETRNQLAEAFKDDSAEMRAVMLTGMAQLFKLQRDLPASHAGARRLKKQVEELDGQANGHQGCGPGSYSRRRRAPGSGTKVQPKPV